MAESQDWGTSFWTASVSAMTVYDEVMVPRLFDPWAELLLDQLQLQRAQSVLDVACGPGTVTRKAALRVGPSGRATGCDFSPAMLELARSKTVDAGAPIEYLECSADALDVPDDFCDVVTCQQGLQFFPDRPAALVEMRRVLRPGGTLGVSVWCANVECPPFAALKRALGQVLGADAADAYESGPWGFGDGAALARLVSESGFTDVDMRKYELPLVFEGGPGQLLLTLRAASVATTIAQLPDADLAALAAAVEDAARPITIEGQIRSHASSHVVTARVSL